MFDGYILLYDLEVLKSFSFEGYFHLGIEKVGRRKVRWVRWFADHHSAIRQQALHYHGIMNSGIIVQKKLYVYKYCLSPRKSRLDPKSAYVGCMVDRTFFECLGISLVSIIPSTLDAHMQLIYHWRYKCLGCYAEILLAFRLFTAEFGSLPCRLQDWACAWGTGEGESGHKQRLPGHGVRCCRIQHLLHNRAVCGQQVWHPCAENWAQLQGLHVSTFIQSYGAHVWATQN